MAKKEDKTEQEEREAQFARERKVHLEDLRVLLRLPEGRRWFKWLMDRGHIFRTTFTGNSTGMFKEGARSLVLEAFEDICEAAPTVVPELIMREPEEEKDGG